MANGIIQFNNQSKSEFKPCFRIHHHDLAGTICWMLILIVDTGLKMIITGDGELIREATNVIVWNHLVRSGY